MKIDNKLLDSISSLAAIRLNQKEKLILLESLNSLIEDFSSLHDFQLEEEHQLTISIPLRKDELFPCDNIEILHQNFPHSINNLLISPLINHDER